MESRMNNRGVGEPRAVDTPISMHPDLNRVSRMTNRSHSRGSSLRISDANSSTLTISPVSNGPFSSGHKDIRNDSGRFNNQDTPTISTSRKSPSRLSGASSIQPMSQVDLLRLWRHDALMQHHYITAEYIGDKIFALTSMNYHTMIQAIAYTDDPNDAFWLAQVHYSSGHYARAREALMGPGLEQSVSCNYLAALCLVRYELEFNSFILLTRQNWGNGKKLSS